MSGYKYSNYLLREQLREANEAIRECRRLRAEVEGRREQLRAMLDEASEGLRATFANEVARARRWLAQEELPEVRALALNVDLLAVRSDHAFLEHVAAEGRHTQEELAGAFTQKADRLGRQLAGQLADLEARYAGSRALLQLWCPPEQVRALGEAWSQAQRLLDAERYAEVQSLLERAAAEMEPLVAHAEEQEDRHQKRLYLLKALRQVCAEMGFQEITPPHFEHEGDRGSRILYTVDTVDRGRISFSLALDKISTFSEIADDRCFEEFGQISQYLEEAFGIQTSFQLADGEPIPRLRQKGELDLPEDAGRYAEGGGGR